MDPFDLEQQSQDIQRKRALQQALGQRALAPQQGDMVSGHYVAPGAGAAIGSLGSALLSRLTGQQADTAQRQWGSEYQSQLKSGLEGYLNTRNGVPGQVMNDAQAGALMNNNQAPTLKDPIKADPRKAIVDAMTSRIPELQKIGQMDFASLNKKPEYKEHLTQDGTIVRTTPDGQVQNLGNFAKPPEKWSEPYTMPGGQGRDAILVKKNLTTGEVKPVDTGTKVNVNTNDTEEQAWKKALGGQKVKILEKSYESAQSAQKAMDAMASARQDLDAGLNSGSTANIALGVQKFGKALGLPGSDDPRIVNSEAYRANMARETLQLVKNLGSGTGISNADREFAEKASGGLLTLDDRTMSRLMDVAQAAAANTLVGHQKLLQQLGGETNSDLGAFNVDFTFAAPNLDYQMGRFQAKPFAGTPRTPGGPAAGPAKGTAQNPMSYEEYLQQRKGK